MNERHLACELNVLTSRSLVGTPALCGYRSHLANYALAALANACGNPILARRAKDVGALSRMQLFVGKVDRKYNPSSIGVRRRYAMAKLIVSQLSTVGDGDVMRNDTERGNGGPGLAQCDGMDEPSGGLPLGRRRPITFKFGVKVAHDALPKPLFAPYSFRLFRFLISLVCLCALLTTLFIRVLPPLA